jgi:hypothetical protein
MILLSTGLLLVWQPSYAQLRTDTTVTHVVDSPSKRTAGAGQDTASSYTKAPTNADSLAFASRPHPFQPNPKKAGLYSALLPGLGQLYNRQYWKIPVVYAGMGVAGYYLIKNLNDYQSYRIAYVSRINNTYLTDKYATIYTTAQLSQLQNDANKYLNLTVLFSGLGYMLQVLDAVTSAHLKNFDISRDISMRMSPIAAPNGIGLGLVFNYK